MTLHEFCLKLQAASIPYEEHRFLSNFWGTRIQFNRKLLKKVEAVLGPNHGLYIKSQLQEGRTWKLGKNPSSWYDLCVEFF